MSKVHTSHATAGKAVHTDGFRFRCGRCNRLHIHGVTYEGGGTGYAVDTSKQRNNLICYACCAKNDKKQMVDDGRATLYLCDVGTVARVTNWPGSLEFKCGYRKGRHNIAGVRYDVWFRGPDGYEWHGVTYGDWTQICHCKRTKNFLG